MALTWPEQVVAPMRWAPLPAVPDGGLWNSVRGLHQAKMVGGWASGAAYVSPINPYSFRTDDQGAGAWVDIQHHVPLWGERGVTIWLDLIVHDLTSRAIIVTSGPGGLAGGFSLEVQPPANGSLIRAWLVDDEPAVQFFGGSQPTNGGISGSGITPGEPFSLALTMGEDGARVTKNGVTLATLSTTVGMRAVTKRFGAWTDGTAQIDATLGDLRFVGALTEHQVAMVQASLDDWRARLG